MWIKQHNFIVHTLRNVMNLARVGHSLHAFCGAAHFYKKIMKTCSTKKFMMYLLVTQCEMNHKTFSFCSSHD